MFVSDLFWRRILGCHITEIRYRHLYICIGFSFCWVIVLSVVSSAMFVWNVTCQSCTNRHAMKNYAIWQRDSSWALVLIRLVTTTMSEHYLSRLYIYIYTEREGQRGRIGNCQIFLSFVGFVQYASVGNVSGIFELCLIIWCVPTPDEHMFGLHGYDICGSRAINRQSMVNIYIYSK